MRPLPSHANAGKCQCIAFSPKGIITESDNTLFNTGAWAGHSLHEKVPFIGTILKHLRKMNAGDAPLFIPRVYLELEGYSGICDFLFTREKQATGEVYKWIVYDHSLHYGLSGQAFFDDLPEVVPMPPAP
jgi:hypothetical protein